MDIGDDGISALLEHSPSIEDSNLEPIEFISCNELNQNLFL